MIQRSRTLIVTIALQQTAPASAAGDPGKQQPVTVTMTMGTAPQERTRFTPDTLAREIGRTYSSRIRSLGNRPGHFGSQGLADVVHM